MSRAFAIALVVLAAHGAAWAVDYCPQQFMGQWNGLFYYQCTYTNQYGQCTTAYVGDTRIHTLSSACPGMCTDPITISGGGDDPKGRKVHLPNSSGQIHGLVKRGVAGIPGSTSDSTDLFGEFRALDFKVVPAAGHPKRKIRTDHLIKLRKSTGGMGMQSGWHVLRLLRIRVSDSEGDIGIGQECDLTHSHADVRRIKSNADHIENLAQVEDRHAVAIILHQPDPDGEVNELPSDTSLRVPFTYYVIMHEPWKKVEEP